MDCFLYDRGLRYERFNYFLQKIYSIDDWKGP